MKKSIIAVAAIVISVSAHAFGVAAHATAAHAAPAHVSIAHVSESVHVAPVEAHALTTAHEEPVIVRTPLKPVSPTVLTPHVSAAHPSSDASAVKGK